MKNALLPQAEHRPANQDNWEDGMNFRIPICCVLVPKKRLLPMAISFNVRWRFGNKIAEMAWISRLPGRQKK
jgi:hypothetical protein